MKAAGLHLGGEEDCRLSGASPEITEPLQCRALSEISGEDRNVGKCQRKAATEQERGA